MERGRPRAFDIEKALDAALAVFWRDGFQTASLSSLTEAMGISKPSLYATFGDKTALYLAALDRYSSLGASNKQALDAEPEAKKAITDFLLQVVDGLTDPATPCGCFVVTGTAACGAEGIPSEIENALIMAAQGTEHMLKIRFQRAQDEGQLPSEMNTDTLAAYFVTLIRGLSMQAKAGASRADLQSVLTMAMKVWPQL